MENIQDWAAYLLDNSHQIPPSYASYARTAYYYANTAKSYINPFITQLTSKPDLATIALLLLIILVSLKILDMLYQTVMFWFRMARKIIFWGGLGVLGLWVYTRGPEGVAEDIGYWWDVWRGEYEHWKEQERIARVLGQQ